MPCAFCQLFNRGVVHVHLTSKVIIFCHPGPLAQTTSDACTFEAVTTLFL